MVEKIQIYEMVMLAMAAAHKLLNLAPEYNEAIGIAGPLLSEVRANPTTNLLIQGF